MEHIKNLRSVFNFPGCVAQATVESYRGDPEAIVITLQRRRKKRYVPPVVWPIDPITTPVRAMCVISHAATGECFYCFDCDE
jgi:hypothetical protein